MSDPTEADLLALIGIEESMTLEFKRGDLLDMNSNKIAEELSREVSGFANAIGGRIIVGMNEEKNGKRRIADALTGIANTDWTAQRLQQLVESNIEPPLRLRFFRVALPSVGPQAQAFVIDVPEGTTAHQARDCLYYVRSEFEVKALRDYEIRLRMNRGATLSAQLEASLVLQRSAKALRDEQLEDYLAAVAGLPNAPAENLQRGAQGGAPPPSPSVSTWSESQKQLVLQTLTPLARYEEVRLTVMMRNDGERTIREYDAHLEFDVPPDWIVARRDDVQPRGGFSAGAELHAAKLLHDKIVSANTRLSINRRLLPQAFATLQKYLLLVPEGAQLARVLSHLRWTTYLDNSPPSRGEIDLLPELRSILRGREPHAPPPISADLG